MKNNVFWKIQLTFCDFRLYIYFTDAERSYESKMKETLHEFKENLTSTLESLKAENKKITKTRTKVILYSIF